MPRFRPLVMKNRNRVHFEHLPNRWLNYNYTWKTGTQSITIIARMIGDELRKVRKAAGLSQEELAFRADVSRNYVSMVELNQNSPTLETLIRICRALGVRAATLVAQHEQDLQKQKRSTHRIV